MSRVTCKHVYAFVFPNTGEAYCCWCGEDLTGTLTLSTRVDTIDLSAKQLPTLTIPTNQPGSKEAEWQGHVRRQ